MSLKFALSTSTLMALAGIFSVIGCGGDECVKAADRWAECIPLSPGAPNDGPDTTQQCADVNLCWSTCINSYGDCETLKKSLTADPPVDSDYMKCVNDCNTMVQ
jgi:hypothetical protein